jgi:serine/threonine-protein kinase
MTDARATDLLEQLRAALADRYAIERKVGEGGMATVYFARELAEPRDVAIKVLRPELAASIGGDRFIREIEVASRLKHPHILGMYDSGEVDDFLWFTMPFVTGESLRDRLEREGQLPLEDALRIIRQVASALAFAHQQGIIHRDIKPENIMLTADGGALVADFGIARAVTQAGGEKLTRTGMAVGTPVYMSPEQAMADKVDARSDEYSVGCVLYEMLVGQPPFTGSNPVALMARHSMEKVPSVRLVRETVPDQVEDVIMKALAKAPADRYQTLDQFVKALEGAETAPLHARRRHGSRQSGGKRWIIVGAVAGVVVLAGAAVLWKMKSAPATADGPAPSQLAILYFEDKSPGKDQAFLADGLTETLIHELSQVKALQVISRNGVAPYRRSAVTDDSISRALGVGTIVRGSVVGIGDSVRVEVAVENAKGDEVDNTKLTRARTDLFALQDELAKEVSIFLRKRVGQEVGLEESRAGTRNVKAWEAEQQAHAMAAGIDSLAAEGDPAGAARETRRVDSMFARVEQMDSRWAAPVVERAWLAYRQARRSGAADQSQYAVWIEPGLAHAERAVAIDARDADALEARGTLRYLKWLVNLAKDPTEAARLLAGAEADLRAAVAANTAQASAWATLAHLLNAKSRTAEAKVAALRAYEADPYLTNASTVVWRLFQNSLDLEDRPEATKWCDEGRRRFPDNPRFIECQIWIFALKGVKPDVPQAWKLLDQYAERYPPNLRPYWTKRGSMLVAMALARANLPDSAKAVATRARLSPSEDPTRELSFFEAIVRVMVGDKDEALRLLNTYYAANPQLREGLDHDETWWFTPLRDDPRYKSLIQGT